MHKVFETELAGRKLSLDFGKYAGLEIGRAHV